MKVWINGQLKDQEEACVSVFDHGLLYGDGVFEGIRVYGGKIFRRRDHLERLFKSAAAIRLEIRLSPQQLTDAMYQAVAANGVREGYIRLVVTRGPGTLGLDPNRCSGSSIIVIADQIKLYPQEMYDNGLAVIVARTRRCSPDMLPPQAKTLNYLNNILAKLEAIDAGAGEALMLNAAGNVAEATGDNVFLVRAGGVITPPVSAGFLIGVTRKVVLELCAKLRLAVREQEIKPEELYSADECFLTGTAAEVIAVTRIAGRQIGSGKAGPVTSRLLEAFRAYIRAGDFD
jgi:branched-chain amino acid aminotransferase